MPACKAALRPPQAGAGEAGRVTLIDLQLDGLRVQAQPRHQQAEHGAQRRVRLQLGQARRQGLDRLRRGSRAHAVPLAAECGTDKETPRCIGGRMHTVSSPSCMHAPPPHPMVR